MTLDKRSNFQHYLYDLEVKQAAEKLEVLPVSIEKATFRQSHVFGNVTQFDETFNSKVDQIHDVLNDLFAMINVSGETFDTLPERKKIAIHAMSVKINQMRNLLLEASDCNFLIKNDYENKVRDAFNSLLKVF